MDDWPDWRPFFVGWLAFVAIDVLHALLDPAGYLAEGTTPPLWEYALAMLVGVLYARWRSR